MTCNVAMTFTERYFWELYVHSFKFIHVWWNFWFDSTIVDSERFFFLGIKRPFFQIHFIRWWIFWSDSTIVGSMVVVGSNRAVVIPIDIEESIGTCRSNISSEDLRFDLLLDPSVSEEVGLSTTKEVGVDLVDRFGPIVQKLCSDWVRHIKLLIWYRLQVYLQILCILPTMF
jgi:hypothetical protein